MMKVKKLICSLVFVGAIIPATVNVSADTEISREEVTQTAGFMTQDQKNSDKFREEFGLVNYFSAVNNARLSSEPLIESSFGIQLTKSEESSLIERIDQQKKVLPSIEKYLDSNNLNDRIVFIDQKNGGIVHIGIKGNNENLSKYDKDMTEIYGDNDLIEVFQTQYSERDLENAHKKLLSYLNKVHNGVKITDINTNVITQKVEVGIENFDESKKKIVESLVDPNIVSVRSSAVVSDSANRETAYNPLQAGTAITNSATNGGCTLGFMAKPTNSTSKFVITAAHCGSAGTSFSQGGNNLGAMGARYFMVGRLMQLQ